MREQFYAGQRVRIKDNCDGNIYGTTESMRRCLGKETIIQTAHLVKDHWWLNLTIDPDFIWDESCVEILEDPVALPSSVIDLL